MKNSYRVLSALAAVIFTVSGCSQGQTAVTESSSVNSAASSDTPTPDSTASAESPAESSSASSESSTAGSSVSSESPTAGTAASETAGTTAGTTSGTTAGTASAETEAAAAAGTTTAQTTAAQTTAAQQTTAAAAKKVRSDLSPNGGYEGRKGTSEYNYGEALQKSIMFYDLQRSGDLPDGFRCNWRGDSCLNDGKDAGLDLTGGFFDAGDNVKFNLPMSYSMSILAWSVIENRKEYEESGQLDYILDNIRWGNDYFIKCHPEPDVYYYQVGDGNADHGWWGACEVVETQMKRPSYKVDLNNGGSTVAAGTAASLASCAVVFKKTDPAYAEKCLKHAKELYAYAEKVKSDSGYTAANGFY